MEELGFRLEVPADSFSEVPHELVWIGFGFGCEPPGFLTEMGDQPVLQTAKREADVDVGLLGVVQTRQFEPNGDIPCVSQAAHLGIHQMQSAGIPIFTEEARVP